MNTEEIIAALNAFDQANPDGDIWNALILGAPWFDRDATDARFREDDNEHLITKDGVHLAYSNGDAGTSGGSPHYAGWYAKEA